MPRSSRSSGGRSAPMGSRSASTMAAPRQAQQQAHPQTTQHAAPGQAAAAPAQGPGLFANMASTAAGVAVGSTVGHGLSSMFFGGGSREAPVEQAQAQYPAQDQQAQQGAYQQSTVGSCEAQAKDFTRCLEAGNDFNSCSYYLEALKACQQAARPY
ncbi:unnamed protein product [Tilletia controversa]|uniref:CHCH domain-containing protein n=3 Tax=Tilletia TaxID=13289 RepID=A0A8X7MXD8_9BASI|nr:hypothetical protein CF336_g2044 [Tilletia laevis]KAE8201548.1 hypothetical protein CF328_g2642 [Tilletia controversa]KAE8263558.1 hypothetical protein A4X03_0g1592 [Tilletia caries]KAE8207137.1 hypothetical protein CF335_g1363 [Tilletia laevis]KAE8252760.1 hypothetical protein A4X06_0g1946 [Tilletia controversa]